MLNLKSLGELKVKLEEHKPDWTEHTSKDVRKYKEQYKQDRITLITKIDLINQYTAKVSKYEADIAEILTRLKKMGFVFITQEPPKRTSPVIDDVAKEAEKAEGGLASQEEPPKDNGAFPPPMNPPGTRAPSPGGIPSGGTDASEKNPKTF